MVRYDDAEARFKKQIQTYILKRGGAYSRIPQGTFAIPGDPDLIIWYRGYAIGLEAKAGTRQHDEQPDREYLIDRAGCIYLLCDKMEQLETLLDRIDALIAEYPRPKPQFLDLIPDYLRKVRDMDEHKARVEEIVNREV